MPETPVPLQEAQRLNPRLLESPESSSPAITRAVAAGLCSKFSDSVSLSSFQRLLLRALGLFPQHLGEWIISRYQSLTALDPNALSVLAIDQLAVARLDDYAPLSGKFPAVIMGAGLGGATAHLSLALGGPFLPQSFVLTIKGGSPDGNVQTYLERSIGLALEFARRNQDALTIQHFDPVHDGWLTRQVNHLRVKLLGLPQVYTRFIRERLEPGGAICFLDCGASWLRYRLDDRSVFQVGGWGDIEAQEYLEGSQRLQRFCEAEGLKHCDWRLPDYPLEEGPESEWGVEPGLGEALAEFCRREGYRFVHISLPKPHDFSRLAFHAMQRLLEIEGRQPAGILIEMFSQFDATAVLHSGLLPLWLVFNTWDSLAFLKKMRPGFPPARPVFFSPLVTFTHTPDLVPWEAWNEALEGLDWRNIGARQSHYPADTAALATWEEPLRRWTAAHSQPVQARLEAEALKAISDSIVL